MQQLKEKKRPIAIRNPETNAIELYDPDTGDLIAIQQKKQDIWETIVHHAVEVQLEDGRKVWVQKGLSPDLIPSQEKYKYSHIVGDLICQKIVEGKSLTAICKEDGMPNYAAICRWRRQNPEFRQNIEDAYRDRGEFLRDEIERLNDSMIGAEAAEIPGTKAAIDNLKWLASKDNAKYDTKQVAQGPAVSSVTFVIETGIRKDEGQFNKDITRVVYSEPLPEAGNNVQREGGKKILE